MARASFLSSSRTNLSLSAWLLTDSSLAYNSWRFSVTQGARNPPHGGCAGHSGWRAPQGEPDSLIWRLRCSMWSDVLLDWP